MTSTVKGTFRLAAAIIVSLAFIIISSQPINALSTVIVPKIAEGTLKIPLGKDCLGYTVDRNYSSYHAGKDYAKKGGCTIVASHTGEVIHAGWRGNGEGFMVEVQGSDGLITRYSHGDGNFYVEVGDRVVAGDPLMYMGTTGASTGIHLHFEVEIDGVLLDPDWYLEKNVVNNELIKKLLQSFSKNLVGF